MLVAESSPHPPRGGGNLQKRSLPGNLGGDGNTDCDRSNVTPLPSVKPPPCKHSCRGSPLCFGHSGRETVTDCHVPTLWELPVKQGRRSGGRRWEAGEDEPPGSSTRTWRGWRPGGVGESGGQPWVSELQGHAAGRARDIRAEGDREAAQAEDEALVFRNRLPGVPLRGCQARNLSATVCGRISSLQFLPGHLHPRRRCSGSGALGEALTSQGRSLSEWDPCLLGKRRPRTQPAGTGNQEEGSQQNQPCWGLDLGLPSLQNCENYTSASLSPAVCGILLQQLERTETLAVSCFLQF